MAFFHCGRSLLGDGSERTRFLKIVLYIITRLVYNKDKAKGKQTEGRPKMSKSNNNWEQEQRNEIIKWSISDLRHYRDKLSLLEKTPKASLGKESLARHYKRMIARKEAFLASEGVAF
jgi:hypothetical protein